MITISLFLLLILIAKIWRIRGNDLVIFLFIVLFPLKSIVPPSEVLLGFLSPDNLIAIFAVIYLPWRDSRIWKKRVDCQKKNSFLFYFAINLVFFYYIVLKDFIILAKSQGPSIKSIVNDVIFLILFAFLLKNLDKDRVYAAIEKAIVVSSIMLGLSIFFAERLFYLGLNPDIGKFIEIEKIVTRPSGFYFNDPNVTGMFSVVYFFFILARILFNGRRNPAYFLALVALFMGIIDTGSRTSFIALFFTMGLVLFSFRRRLKTTKLILILAVLIGVLLFVYHRFGSPMNERFASISGQPQFGTSFAERVTYWRIYLEAIGRNPEFLIIGNLDPQPIERAIHNFYIQMLYSGGIPIILIYFSLIRRIVRFRNKLSNPNAFPIVHSLIACSICLLTLSDFPPNNLALVIALSSGLTPISLQRMNPLPPLAREEGHV